MGLLFPVAPRAGGRVLPAARAVVLRVAGPLVSCYSVPVLVSGRQRRSVLLRSAARPLVRVLCSVCAVCCTAICPSLDGGVWRAVCPLVVRSLWWRPLACSIGMAVCALTCRSSCASTLLRRGVRCLFVWLVLPVSLPPSVAVLVFVLELAPLRRPSRYELPFMGCMGISAAGVRPSSSPRTCCWFVAGSRMWLFRPPAPCLVHAHPSPFVRLWPPSLFNPMGPRR